MSQDPNRQLQRGVRSALRFTWIMLLAACASVAPASSGGTRAAVDALPDAPPPEAPAVPPHPYLTRLELEVVAELNLARTDPAAYARHIEAMVPWFDGRLMRQPGRRVVIETREGAAAVREAVRELRRMRPVPAVTVSRGMSAAARDHVRDQGATGETGHSGRDGSRAADRVARYGTWRRGLSENIAYGPPTAREVVVGLIVDDGVPDRGHRTNLFDPLVRVVGVSCGRHTRFQVMCVVVHAHGFEEGTAP